MAYYEDLTSYEYGGEAFFRPGTKNVGWLATGHQFPRAVPSDVLLGTLWQFCKVSVAQARGFHICEICGEKDACFPTRGGESLMLGTSEIRVFASGGEIFAAPTLIYHYVAQHDYAPPAVFVTSLVSGPAPPQREYFERLEALGLKWNPTSPRTNAVHPR
jgi:hypothetical protein